MRNTWGCLTALMCSLVLTAFPFYLEAKASEVDEMFEELLCDSSIVHTRQIKIPGYHNAYNPSLIPYKDGYLLSFRYISRCPETVEGKFRTDVSFIGLVRLDKKFKVFEKTVQFLNIVSHSSNFSLTAEDARLLTMGDRVFVFFNDLPLMSSSGGFAMYFGELVEQQGMFVLKEPAKPLNYLHASPIEKNWSPFVSGDRLYLIYSDQPRVILELDLNTGYCQEVARTDVNWNWNLGQIRGGTPACLVNETFLTFFHSSFPAKTTKKRAYVMGAYTFDMDPPFTVRTMTFRPLGNLEYYTEDNPPKVIFPGGMVVQDHSIHVAWGKADKKIFITTFNRDKLLASMQPCSE